MRLQLKICRGKDCTRRSEAWSSLWDLESETVSVGNIKCQDYCKGPVVQVRRGRRKFWFKKIRSEALRQDLHTFLQDGSMSAALVRHLVRVG